MYVRSTLGALFAHNDWARDTLFSLASALDDTALDRPFDMGPGSLRRTLFHLWTSERLWLDCWRGDPDPQLPADIKPDQSLVALHERFQHTARERNAFLDAAGEDGLDRKVHRIDSQGCHRDTQLCDLALHVCNHGIHHRAQALNMLRRVGGKTPGLDYLFFKIKASPAVPQLQPELLSRYCRYGDWAQHRLLAAATSLRDEQLDRPFEIGLGGLRKTLVHICDIEQWWLDNWLTETPLPEPELRADLSVADLTARYDAVSAGRSSFLAGCTSEDLQRTVTAGIPEGQVVSFSVGETLLELCGHATHHRAQALNMLRHLGADTPALDYHKMVDGRAGTCS